MSAIYRNRGRAFTHLLARVAEEAEAGVPDREVDAALARIVAQRFGGDAAAFNAAMAALGLNERLTRELVADQLRRGRLVGLVDVGRLSFTQVAELYAARGGRWARRVRVDPAPAVAARTRPRAGPSRAWPRRRSSPARRAAR